MQDNKYRSINAYFNIKYQIKYYLTILICYLYYLDLFYFLITKQIKIKSKNFICWDQRL